MANFNRVILAGNLTRDPQLSMLPSNTPVCDFGMAINRKWKSQSGEMRDDTCFIDLRIYGRRAEVINQYMSKGRPLMIEERGLSFCKALPMLSSLASGSGVMAVLIT